MSSELIEALGFNGRYASETEREATSRRIAERRHAAATIAQLQAELSEAREVPGRIVDWLRQVDPYFYADADWFASAIEARDWSKP